MPTHTLQLLVFYVPVHTYISLVFSNLSTVYCNWYNISKFLSPYTITMQQGFSIGWGIIDMLAFCRNQRKAVWKVLRTRYPPLPPQPCTKAFHGFCHGCKKSCEGRTAYKAPPTHTQNTLNLRDLMWTH